MPHTPPSSNWRDCTWCGQSHWADTHCPPRKVWEAAAVRDRGDATQCDADARETETVETLDLTVVKRQEAEQRLEVALGRLAKAERRPTR